MIICIDPGHGGEDPGAQTNTPFYYTEKQFNLSLAKKVQTILEDNGHTVYLTRDGDQYISLYDRAQIANSTNADVFVSIHANGSSDPTSEGMEAFHYTGSSSGRSLANLILNSMHDEFRDHIKRGVFSANFAVLRLTLMPAALIECEFITNPHQARFLQDERNQNIMAEAIARGIQIF
ncbi:N-acetylmuramoyl-L-alanine amidase [candidate division KSB1 bacterium]|nr:N-acetylmuramoyl-L-alanine amidase [candidate division KSB1 bacterium]